MKCNQLATFRFFSGFPSFVFLHAVLSISVKVNSGGTLYLGNKWLRGFASPWVGRTGWCKSFLWCKEKRRSMCEILGQVFKASSGFAWLSFQMESWDTWNSQWLQLELWVPIASENPAQGVSIWELPKKARHQKSEATGENVPNVVIHRFICYIHWFLWHICNSSAFKL